MITTTLDNAINMSRTDIKRTAENVKSLMDAMKFQLLPNGANAGEIAANLTLAYRHLEDASMRLGKAIQAYDGGASVYDPNTTVGCADVCKPVGGVALAGCSSPIQEKEPVCSCGINEACNECAKGDVLKEQG